MPVRLPPGRARLATRPSLTGSSPTHEDDGDRRGCRLGRERRSGTSGRGDHGDLSANQFGRQLRQPIDIDSRPSGIRSPRSRPRHSRCPSGPGEMRADGPRSCQAIWRRGTRSPASPAAARAPRAASAAAPPSSVMNSRRSHSITSSARASSVGGTSRPSALAVLRLITSSYLVGACTGRSAGFSPLRMRST